MKLERQMSCIVWRLGDDAFLLNEASELLEVKDKSQCILLEQFTLDPNVNHSSISLPIPCAVDSCILATVDAKLRRQTWSSRAIKAWIVMDASFEAKYRPLSTLSVFSFIPPRRTETKEMRYLNNTPKVRSNLAAFTKFKQKQCPTVMLRFLDMYITVALFKFSLHFHVTYQ